MNVSMISILITLSSLIVVINVIFSFYRLSDRYRNYSLLFMGLNLVFCAFFLPGLYLQLISVGVGCFVFAVSLIRLIRKM